MPIKQRPLRLCLTLALGGLLTHGAFATEGGGSTYPVGTENFTAAAAPPPGLYVLEYLSRYTATRVNDAQGNAVPLLYGEMFIGSATISAGIFAEDQQ